MIHFQSKGKGILVPVYAVVPIFVLFLLTKFISESYFNNKIPSPIYQIVSGLSLILSGLWNWKTCENYYIDDNGEKRFIDLNNQFMWINMKVYSCVFWIFGGFALLGGIVELISYFNKS